MRLDRSAYAVGRGAGWVAYRTKIALEDETVREYVLIYGLSVLASLLSILTRKARSGQITKPTGPQRYYSGNENGPTTAEGPAPVSGPEQIRREDWQTKGGE